MQKSITLIHDKTSLVSRDMLAVYNKQLQLEIDRIQRAIAADDYETPYASVNVSADAALRDHIRAVVQQKKSLKPTVLIVIGIGGSNLGTMAVQQALVGILYNEHDPAIKIYYADTVDSDYIYDIVLLAEQELEKGRTVLLTIISKSGTTTETIANAAVFIDLLRQAYGADYYNYVVVTTDEGSVLWQLAQKERYACLVIPKNVGGRFSVLSTVGLFPLAMLGIDIDALHHGARDMRTQCVESDIFKNPAALSAAIIYEHYTQNIAIHNTFLFSVDLEGVGKWYRQLLAESVGKTIEIDGIKKYVGITPTVSIGSTDLHSIGQLYLGGPYTTFTTFVTVKKNKSDITVPSGGIDQLVEHIGGTSMPALMHAIVRGVQTTYHNDKRPFVTIELPEKSAYYIGQLLQLKMIEIVYLSYLCGVSPFDQPQVELYKKETRAILAHE